MAAGPEPDAQTDTEKAAEPRSDDPVATAIIAVTASRSRLRGIGGVSSRDTILDRTGSEPGIEVRSPSL